MKTDLKKLKNSEIEISFELTAEEFEKHFQKALEHLKDHVKVDGFRKGKVPTSMVEERVGQENVLMEAGDIAVKAVYPQFIEEQKLEPIGDPEVSVVKIAKGSEFIFKVNVSVIPEIVLPDYKELAKKIKAKEVSVDESEIEDTLKYLQKSRAKFTAENRGAQAKDFVEIEYSTAALNEGKAIKDRFILGEGGFLKDFEDNILGMKAGEEKEFTAKFPDNTPRTDLAGKPAVFKVKMVSVQKMELSPIDDEFAKGLGAFDTLAALKENLKEGIIMEKRESEKQRTRSEMLEKISEKVNLDIPEKMIDFEKDRLMEDLKSQVSSQFGITFEQYLNSVKKNEDDIKKSFKLEAEKRIKNFLVLRGIGKAEKVEVTPQEVAQDLPKLMKNYTKAQLEKIDIGQLTEYSKGAIFNEKVFQILEKLSHQ